ncbi:MAG: DUF6157 family protein [Cytophagales bacterium]|nr:DUF6157 family protein [Cytophagales bacterium]
MTSTNYFNTLIEIAEDSPIQLSEIPPQKGDKKSVANLQFEMLYEQPYKYSSDEVLFSVFAERNEIPEGELSEQKEVFFSKGQPCFRASPLTKRYGWGVHCNSEGKIALIPCNQDKYMELLKDSTIKKVKAMRSKRK